MSVYHTVHTSSDLFVIAFPCYFCQCPRAKVPCSCILGYGRPVSSSLQLLHSVLLNQHYQSHLSRTPTWFYLTDIINSFVHDALTFYLLGNLWLLYLEFNVHKNPEVLTAQPVTSARRLSFLPSSSVAVATSSAVTSCTSNVSAASRSWNSNGTGSSHSSSELRKRLGFARSHQFSYFGSLTIHRPPLDFSHLFVYFLFVVSILLFRSLPFFVCRFLVYLLHGWNYCCSTFFFVDSSMLSMPFFVTELRCRTDGSDIQLLLASSNHLNVDLISVPPHTPDLELPSLLFDWIPVFQSYHLFLSGS